MIPSAQRHSPGVDCRPLLIMHPLGEGDPMRHRTVTHRRLMRRSPRFLVTFRLPLAISDLEAGASFMSDVRESRGSCAMVRKHLLWCPVDESGDTLWNRPASPVDKSVDRCGQTMALVDRLTV